MAYSEQQQLTNLLEAVQKVAQQIEQFTRQQKAHLLQLVPELQSIQPQEAEISAQQLDLIAYFEGQMEALPEGRRMQDDDIFMSDVTVGEFFALPEPERSRLWAEAHLEAERELGYREQEVRPDAITFSVRALRFKRQ